MNGHTYKHTTNKLGKYVQRATTNIPVYEVEHLLSCVFLLSAIEEEKLISIFPTQNQLKSP
jgi:hypothetical protein